MSAVVGVETGVLPEAPVGSTEKICHVALVGDVSGLRAMRLDTVLLTQAGAAERLVVNLSRVTHLSLDAVRSLVRARALVERRGAQFRVQGLNRTAALALARAGLLSWVSPRPRAPR